MQRIETSCRALFLWNMESYKTKTLPKLIPLWVICLIDRIYHVIENEYFTKIAANVRLDLYKRTEGERSWFRNQAEKK